MEQLLNQKEHEFFDFMEGATAREEYQLEFVILKGQIDMAFAQAIAFETGQYIY